MPLVFAIHPRTVAAATRMGLESIVAAGQQKLICLGPQPYLDTLSLVSGAPWSLLIPVAFKKKPRCSACLVSL